MAYSDSESSGDNQSCQETNVLLGYADKAPNGETLSRLGGRPDWIDPAFPPSAALARCKVCQDLMVLLLQLNAELPQEFPDHQRRLYVFSCRRKTCRRKLGSIRALRSIRIDKSKLSDRDGEGVNEEPKPSDSAQNIPGQSATSSGIGEALFGVKPQKPSALGNPNPFSTPFSYPFSNPLSDPFSNLTSTSFLKQEPTTSLPSCQDSTQASHPRGEPSKQQDDLSRAFAKAASLNTTQEVKPLAPSEPRLSPSLLPEPYPVAWLADAEYETLDPIPEPKVPASKLKAEDDSVRGGKGREDKEVFESTMDAVFQRFADRVGQNPDQCIRYEFRGQPLLYSKSDAVGKLLHSPDGGATKVSVTRRMPRCENCGAGRVFEVQLTPHSIVELEAQETDLDGMEWGTVIVGVCEKDCQERGRASSQPSYAEEWAGVQWEELKGAR